MQIFSRLAMLADVAKKSWLDFSKFEKNFLKILDDNMLTKTFFMTHPTVAKMKKQRKN